ncbi:MAG: cobalamin-dependent protein [Phycisphaerae bacterium]|nr:cobalamin-dependent protein [Phycisphaerae bacterium]
MTARNTSAMKLEDRQHAEAIDAIARAIAEWTVERQYEVDPSLERRYGRDGRHLWRAEVRSLVQHLAEAIAADRCDLFVHQARWSLAGFLSRDVTPDDLSLCLRSLHEVLESELPKGIAARALPFIDKAIANIGANRDLPPSAISSAMPNASLARLYLLHLLQRDQQSAANTIFEAHREGKSLAEIYETVIGPALREVGRMWHLQEASVADEHYCTAATQMIMSQLRARMTKKPPIGKRLLAASVGGDLHDIGLRMVSDLFEADGWDTEYLGANMPIEEIVASLVDEDGHPIFDLLAVSAGTTLSVRGVAALIDLMRGHPGASNVPVLVGGGPFAAIPDLWKVVGADGYATNAVSALATARSLVGARV